MLELVDAIFLGMIAVAVPAIMIGLVLLIAYAIYREVRGGER
jgi:hypothetical protein